MKKLLIGLVAIAGILLVVLFLVRKKKSKESIASSPSDVKSPGGSTSSGSFGSNSSSLDKNKLLGMGSRGAEVEALQNWINTQIAANIASGMFGNDPNWEDLQQPISQDGVFGQQTEDALFIILSKRTVTLNELENV